MELLYRLNSVGKASLMFLTTTLDSILSFKVTDLIQTYIFVKDHWQNNYLIGLFHHFH